RARPRRNRLLGLEARFTEMHVNVHEPRTHDASRRIDHRISREIVANRSDAIPLNTKVATIGKPGRRVDYVTVLDYQAHELLQRVPRRFRPARRYSPANA